MPYMGSSGNNTVDAMGQFAMSGNITPMEWYKTIVRENGKPYLLAITILSDIVYWFRPTEVRDERTGQVIGWRKKFSGDLLQKSYKQYENLFGESKRSIKAAFDVKRKTRRFTLYTQNHYVWHRMQRSIHDFGSFI